MPSIEFLYSLFKKTKKISTDSRQDCNGEIFIALKGGNFNGNHFAEQAINNGCSYAIIDEKTFVNDDRYILVDNVLDTLQELAIHHRKQLKIPVICITGSNGKTTSKELINAVLSSSFKVSSTKGNLNNHIGVPLTILEIPLDAEIAVVEIGANHIGEIDFLCKIAKPTFGLITNIGKAHLEGFGGIEGVKKAKAELYNYLKIDGGKAFVNSDNKMLMELSAHINCIYYGANNKCKGLIISENPFLNIIATLNNSKKLSICSNLMGAYNFENVLAAVCIGNYFGVNSDSIIKAIEDYVPNNNRSQIIESENNTILLDAYNANPMNMKATLNSFSNDPASKKMVILGDMLELGTYSEEEHSSILNLLVKCNFNQVVLVGEQFGKVETTKAGLHFNTVQDAGKWLIENPPVGMKILIKASRGIGLETLIDYLK